MAYLQVTVCLALASVAFADFTLFGYCSSGVDYSDPFVMTQEGFNMLSNLDEMTMVGVSGKEDVDWLYSCGKLAVSTTGTNVTVTYTAVDKDGVPVTYMARGPPSKNNNVIRVWPVDGAEPFPVDVFNAQRDGSFYLYVSYLSATELVLRTCQNSFWGSFRKVYIFTSQPNELMVLDDECLLSAVASLPSNDKYSFKMLWDRMGACGPSIL